MGKYGVVIGVNYTKNPEAALQGCCNDARLMVDLLRSKGFEDDDIKLLIDDDDGYESPNHINVKNALNWLCTSREDGDIIFLHFSGHGTQIPADDDDLEPDKLDEAICLEELFLMADDDLKQYFSQLPSGAHATVVMDCCHSGSMLDGTEVAIEGAKDSYSEGVHQESSALLNILGGSRGLEEVSNRSLPISTISEVMSQKLGRPVEPTGSGVNGAMASIFGGTAGKLMLKFAMSQLKKQEASSGGGSGGAIGSLVNSFLGGSSNTASSSGGAGGLISSFLGGGSSGGSSGGSALSSLFGGGSSGTSQQQDPIAMVSGLLGGLGLEGTESSSAAPPYNPSHQPVSKDVCTLITGCQAAETSADVRPPGGDAFGALTKTLTTVYEGNPDTSYYDLVSNVRSELSKGGFKQNPCLECSDDMARTRFIC